MDPITTIIGGFTIHVYFELYQKDIALRMYRALLYYLETHNIRPTYSNYNESLYDTHILPCFTIHIMGIDPKRDNIQAGGAIKAITQIGYVISWLSLNRNGLTVYIYPNTLNSKNDTENRILDRNERAIWISDNRIRSKL